MLDLITPENIFRTVFIAAVLYLGVIRSMLSLAPWLPIPRKDLERVRKAANLGPGDTFVEVGCGDGRVLRFVAKRHPNVQVIGIEISLIMFLVAKLNLFFSWQRNVSVKYGNALKYDFSKADVVYTYSLTDTVNNLLMPKLKQELKPGARLVSYIFRIKDNEKQVRVLGEGERAKIYIYQQPGT